MEQCIRDPLQPVDLLSSVAASAFSVKTPNKCSLPISLFAAVSGGLFVVGCLKLWCLCFGHKRPRCGAW